MWGQWWPQIWWQSAQWARTRQSLGTPFRFSTARIWGENKLLELFGGISCVLSVVVYLGELWRCGVVFCTHKSQRLHIIQTRKIILFACCCSCVSVSPGECGALRWASQTILISVTCDSWLLFRQKSVHRAIAQHTSAALIASARRDIVNARYTWTQSNTRRRFLYVYVANWCHVQRCDKDKPFFLQIQCNQFSCYKIRNDFWFDLVALFY